MAQGNPLTVVPKTDATERTDDPVSTPPGLSKRSLIQAIRESTRSIAQMRWNDPGFSTPQKRLKFSLPPSVTSEGSAMTDMSTIVEKVDKISTQHQSEVHRLETRMDSRISEVTTSFHELRRDTREDLREMKAAVVRIKDSVDDLKETTRKAIDDIKDSTRIAVDGVNKSNKAIAWSVALVGIGLVLATIWAVYYGTWTILGSLTSLLQLMPPK